ncbi:hypothetical protein VTL71DRAFT_9160 [Oculimacula yallundae]|uniref:ABC transporter domain-containing protein n=1 Tax=Oculimacula yallundae TaxID=86028 RepID=A0ABR4BS90_9HELO
MSQDAKDTTEPSFETQPHRGITSSVREYLALVDQSSQAFRLGSGNPSHRYAIFKDIKVWGSDSESESEYLETITNIFLQPFALIYKAISHKKPVDKMILYGIDGFVAEGEMLLALGRPGSGCTTLFKTLAGHTDTFNGWSGDVSYFGVDVEEAKLGLRGDLVYNAEADVHFPTLNVLSTLEFAVQAKTSTKGIRHPAGLHKVESFTEKLLQIFGLEATRYTLVGNDLIRGVSSGERKRVSLAEILSTNARITLWDNSTQGLDATNSLRFGTALSTYVKSGHNIALAALYQASDDLVNMFDKIILLHEGRQIFFGTVQEAKLYLEDLGFVWHDRQSLIPRTLEDWERCWRETEYYAKLQKFTKEHLARATDTTGIHAASQPPLRKRTSYVLPWIGQFMITLKRSFIRLGGDKPFLLSNIVGPIIIALVVGSAFYDTGNNTNGLFSQQGVIFFSLLFNPIQTLVEISTQFAQRPIVEKQIGFAMYHPGIDAIASLITLYPVKLMGVSCFNIILYFLSGLRREAGAFFIFMLFTYTTVLTMATMFRVVGAVNKHESIAISVGGAILLPLIVYTGYIIPKTSMHPWFKWITYINPVSYAFESLMANEFHGRSVPCSTLVPSGLGYSNISIQNQVCPLNRAVAGSSFVSGDRYIEASFQYTHAHLWRNYGILLGFFFGLTIVYGLAVEFIPQVVKGKGDVLVFLQKQRSRQGQKKRLEEKTHGFAPQNSLAIPAGQIFDLARTPTKLEFRKEVFTWDKLQYEIPVKDGIKALLTNIHGFVKPGQMTALMGESGAGKTTLLNVLAQRIHAGTIHGSIRLNGLPLDQTFARNTGFVESQDVHLPEFTVRETLRFSARLRQPHSVSEQAKNDYVEEIIRMLDMVSFAEAVVGVPGSGLSLEQRKKMTSRHLQSYGVFASLRMLGKQYYAPFINQAEVFLSNSTDCYCYKRVVKVSTLETLAPIAKLSSSTLKLMELSSIQLGQTLQNISWQRLRPSKDGNNWANIWQKSDEAAFVEQEITSFSKSAQSASRKASNPAASNKNDSTSYLYQYLLVQQRSLLWHWRSPVYIRGKILLNLLAGLFVGFTFYQQDNSPQGLQNKLFATFAVVIQSAPMINALQPRFFTAKALFESREEPAGMYHWSILIITVGVTEILINLIMGALFFLPWYFVIGFGNGIDNSSSRGAYEWLLLMMFETWISTFGHLIAGIAPSRQAASQLIPIFVVFVVLFCGVLQPFSKIPKFWRFVHFASPFTWLIGGLLSNILHGVNIICSPTEINIFQPPSNVSCGSFLALFLTQGPGAVYNPTATENCEYCRYATGDQYLDILAIGWSGRWRDFGVMFAYVTFNVGCLLLLTGLPKWIKGRRRAAERKDVADAEKRAPQDVVEIEIETDS